MKKISSVISLSFLVFFLLVFLLPSICFSEQPDSKVWEYFSDNMYYNKTNLIKSSNIVSVWTYNIVDDDFRRLKIEEVKKTDLEKSIKYQHYDHSVYLDEIDCKNRLWRLKEMTDYNAEGDVLFFERENNNWTIIYPGTINSLYDKVCVTKKKQLNKK